MFRLDRMKFNILGWNEAFPLVILLFSLPLEIQTRQYTFKCFFFFFHSYSILFFSFLLKQTLLKQLFTIYLWIKIFIDDNFLIVTIIFKLDS
jgi:hypothetical protein